MSQICNKCGALATNLVLSPTDDFASNLPDLTRLLTSNDAPLESEVAAARGIISSGQSRLDALSAQIHDFQTTPTELLRTRDETEHLVHQHRAILSPVRRVPPELLCEIFSLAVQNDGDAPKQPPWYLGQVCSLWRHSALSLPSLWSSITMSSVSSGESGPVSLFETQLLRSADTPLDVYWPNVGWSVGPLLRDLVLAHCGRWRRLRLEETQSAPPFHRIGLAVTLPHLRHLTLDNLRFLFDLTAPSLTELISLSAPPMSMISLISFAQRSGGSTLTKLVLRDFPVGAGLVSVLQAFPAITYLLVEASGGGDHGALFAALTLSGSPTDLCPNLTSFLYGDLYEPKCERPWDNFMPMIHSRSDSSQQNRCRLEFLRIFHFVLMDKPSGEDLDGFQSVRDRGLNADFLYEADTRALLGSTSSMLSENLRSSPTWKFL